VREVFSAASDDICAYTLLSKRHVCLTTQRGWFVQTKKTEWKQQHRGESQFISSVIMGKGKLRAGIDAIATAELRADVSAASTAASLLPGFADGTLPADKVHVLRNEHLARYVENFFRKYGYEFPRGYTHGCGHCLTRAMDTDTGYISEEELRDAHDAKQQWEARKEAKQLAKAARKSRK
jgi:hypothetical protein